MTAVTRDCRHSAQPWADILCAFSANAITALGCHQCKAALPRVALDHIGKKVVTETREL